MSGSQVLSYQLLGVKVHALTLQDMNLKIGQAVSSRSRMIVVSQNLHSVYIFHRDRELRLLHSLADYVRVDGTPILLFGRILGYPLGREHRFGWMDWIEPFMSTARQNGWRLFYLGSRPGVAEKGIGRLRQQFPGLEIGFHHGYFDVSAQSEESQAVVSAINAYRPDILIVGMGMPRQEKWILRNHEGLNATVLITSGACLDYIAGAIPTPPRWLGPVGLEWLFRLASEPTRLWRRYLVEPWFAVGLFAADLWTKLSGSQRR